MAAISGTLQRGFPDPDQARFSDVDIAAGLFANILQSAVEWLWRRRQAGIRLSSGQGDVVMNVEDILRQKGTDVVTIEPEASIKRAAYWLRAKNIGALVVAKDDAIAGIISERDIARALSEHDEPILFMPVKDIMTHRVITIAPEDDINCVMRLMTSHRVRHLPVLRNGKLAGIVTIGDVVKRRLDDLELETSVLRDVYMAHR